jgi:ATP-dependent Clp protease protease subunit
MTPRHTIAIVLALLLVAFGLSGCAHKPTATPKPVPGVVGQPFPAFLPFALPAMPPPPPPKVTCPPIGRCVPVYVFEDEVNDESSEQARAWLKAANEAGAKEILFVIDTPGGNVEAGIELIKDMEKSTVPISCVVDHKAFSMGFAILQGGCSRRLILKRSRLMAHQVGATGMLAGHSVVFRNAGADLESEDKAMAEICSAKLKITRAEYEARIAGGKELWLAWEEALSIGAVDEVVTSVEAVRLDLLRKL